MQAATSPAGRVGGIRWLALVLAVWAVLAPSAHFLEMPNKLVLDGPLWLAVQQSLYRGWGPLIGAPSEIGGLLLGLLLWRRSRRSGRLHALAALCYALMLASFFIFNAPVNAALSGWMAATLPPDWASYRLRWEAGHALSALLAMVALFATIKAALDAVRPPGAAS